MEKSKGVNVLLAIAVVLDVVGVVVFLVGIFAPLSFWDFLVLSGPLLIFVSLIPWILWYMGSLMVPEDELSLLGPNIL